MAIKVDWMNSEVFVVVGVTVVDEMAVVLYVGMVGIEVDEVAAGMVSLDETAEVVMADDLVETAFDLDAEDVVDHVVSQALLAVVMDCSV